MQAPKNSQNLNRYSYVLNNPLSYTEQVFAEYLGEAAYYRDMLQRLWDGRAGHDFMAAGTGNWSRLGTGAAPLTTEYMQAATVAGSVSVQTDRKFGNGATTAALAFAFNQLPSSDSENVQSEGVEDSAVVGVSANLHEKLRAGIVVNQDGARAVFRLPIGQEFALTVNAEGIGKLSVGGNDISVDDQGLVNGAGVNIRRLNLTGRALDSGQIQFSGRVSVPLFANRVGLSLGLTRKLNVSDALMSNSGMLGRAARGVVGRPESLSREICRQSGGSDC